MVEKSWGEAGEGGHLHNINPYMAQLSPSLSPSHPLLIDSFI